MLSKLGRIASHLRSALSKYKFSETLDLAIIGGGSGGLACAKTYSELAAEHELLEK